MQLSVTISQTTATKFKISSRIGFLIYPLFVILAFFNALRHLWNCRWLNSWQALSTPTARGWYFPVYPVEIKICSTFRSYRNETNSAEFKCFNNRWSTKSSNPSTGMMWLHPFNSRRNLRNKVNQSINQSIGWRHSARMDQSKFDKSKWTRVKYMELMNEGGAGRGEIDPWDRTCTVCRWWSGFYIKNMALFWCNFQTFGIRVLGVMAWIMPVSVACSTFGAANGSTFGNARFWLICWIKWTWNSSFESILKDY